MRIAVIGAGNVGKALADRFAKAGEEVVYGVRDPAAAKHAPLTHPRLGVRDAAAGADCVVLATPWSAAEGACKAMAPLHGKIVIDCTNPLAMGPAGLGLAVGHTISGGELVAGWCVGASVFKAFNSVGFEVMKAPELLELRPVMFVAGDDEARKPQVLALVGATGFEAIDAGPLRNARLLEPLAMLWIDQAIIRRRGRDFAFALARPKR
ncbi:MAG: NAD(P)-binding domain-containing protein [Enhydrobacter sp.]|nr:MAG: NAD(P)-binding domain-containing protein [Enhydrobacter sp.]